ncbi:DUF2690 domain-containing protein [Rhodococcoides fascians A25f]|uniref:DUF2690 domain-containing protein n=1 Tax=Rhodococcoides fascians TaxID=1828 RepID=UPI0013FDAB26|nr:DUF2690 domain-containing protein [Rhodococcus fascians]QII07877.1 DUF2690 domain-containing protein [Rhodococcus fascians A25f]
MTESTANKASGLLPDARSDEEGNDTVDSAEKLLAPFRAALVELNESRRGIDALAHRAKSLGYKPCSRSTMSNVQLCLTLPTATAVASYVAAVTGDDATQVKKFVAWRDNIKAELDPSPAPAALPSPPNSPIRRTRWIRDCVIICTTVIVTAAATTAINYSLFRGHETASGPAVTTGHDPIEAGCIADAVRANLPTTSDQFTLVAVYSPSCNAVWGKAERLDGQGSGNTISVTTYRADEKDGPDTQTVVEHDVGNAYTPIVLRQGPTDRICVDGSMTIDEGQAVVDSIDPQCT